jgi:hypothetical protein
VNETAELYNKIKIHIHKFNSDNAHIDAHNAELIENIVMQVYSELCLGEPVQAVGEPTQATREPSGEPAKAVGEPTQAVGEPTQAVGEPSGEPAQAVGGSAKAAKAHDVYTALILPMSKNLYSLELYAALNAQILRIHKYNNKVEYFRILSVVEQVKDELLKKDAKKIQLDTQKNPYFKSFGLMPITDNLSIGQVSNLVFGKDVEDFRKFADLCRSKKYNLILITKYNPVAVDYKIMDLLDFPKSKEFDILNKKDDGINSDISKRNETIFYVKDNKKSNKWENDYKFVVDGSDSEFVLILESNVLNKYHIMSNYFNTKVHFIRKSQIIELEQFIRNKKKVVEPSRIDNYNNDINHYITGNMFLNLQPNVDDLKIKATVMDPKYIRNTVLINMISAYKKKYKAKANDLQSFNSLVHDEIFIEIFENTVMNEYTGYLIKNIDTYAAEYVSVSEIYMSFLPVIDTYSKSFKKKIHDKFTLLYNNFDMNIFKMSETDKAANLERVFTETTKDILSSVITLNSNMFQSLIYKVMLFRLSIIN